MERGPVVLVWFLILGGAAVLVMIGVALSTRLPSLPQADLSRSGYAVRRWWFWLLGASVLVSFALSLPSFPYPSETESMGFRHFAVVAAQFSFQIPQLVPLKTKVMFDVTSRDVNHGFGIYDPRGALVAQVQAMPGYTNHLPVEFTMPGKYTIRCLEYCGIEHHLMQAGFEVR